MDIKEEKLKDIKKEIETIREELYKYLSSDEYKINSEEILETSKRLDEATVKYLKLTKKNKDK